jgi:hypothetical protein
MYEMEIPKINIKSILIWGFMVGEYLSIYYIIPPSFSTCMEPDMTDYLVIFIHPARENNSFNPQLFQPFQLFYS